MSEATERQQQQPAGKKTNNRPSPRETVKATGKGSGNGMDDDDAAFRTPTAVVEKPRKPLLDLPTLIILRIERG